MLFIYFNLQDFIVIKTNTIFRGNLYPKNSKENLNKIKNFRSLFYIEKETKPLNLGISFCRISTNNSIENRFVQDFYSKVLVWFRFNLDFEENICLNIYKLITAVQKTNYLDSEPKIKAIIEEFINYDHLN